MAADSHDDGDRDVEQPTIDDVIEHAIQQVESDAESAAKYDGEQGAFFAGARAAYAGVVEKFGSDEDFDEALKRGSKATQRVQNPTEE